MEAEMNSEMAYWDAKRKPIAWFFPRFQQVTGNYMEFRFVHCAVFSCCDWSEYLLGIGFSIVLWKPLYALITCFNITRITSSGHSWFIQTLNPLMEEQHVYTLSTLPSFWLSLVPLKTPGFWVVSGLAQLSNGFTVNSTSSNFCLWFRTEVTTERQVIELTIHAETMWTIRGGLMLLCFKLHAA